MALSTRGRRELRMWKFENHLRNLWTLLKWNVENFLVSAFPFFPIGFNDKNLIEKIHEISALKSDTNIRHYK